MNNLSQGILETIVYSDKFAFPLTLEEIWYWDQSSSQKGKIKTALDLLVSKRKLQKRGPYYFLPGKSAIVSLREKRSQESARKWVLAKKVGETLKRIPTIEAIFVTGSLAVNNSKTNDDLDFFIVTKPNTLWLTRPVIWLFLTSKGLRRTPLEYHSKKIKDKICDNLYLDSSSLSVKHSRNNTSFLAHELLQAVPLFDKAKIETRLLLTNRWVKKVFPHAFRQKLKLQSKNNTTAPEENVLSFVYYPFNLFFFFLQYLYMFSKITSESVSLHSAYFHPNQALDNKPTHSLK